MYGPKHYTETDREQILEFMLAHPFVTLITNDGTKSYATQLPVMIDERAGELYIQGHVSRHTDHYPILEKNPETLLLFTGVHCYISASWYTRRGEASTWNYMTVQARGSIRLFDERESLDLLKALTHQYEDRQAKPELVENMPEDYVAVNAKAIRGFEIKVSTLNATFKLSQNRDDESYKNIVVHLMNSDDINDISMAGELMQRRPELFE